MFFPLLAYTHNYYHNKERQPMSDKSPKKLTKGSDKKIAGVLSGVAEYFNLDPTLVRVGFMVLAVFTGVFPALVIYVIAALIMPSK
jgi:phage shock protein PspC (stress-responsive transcriptional regulator)